MAQDTSFIPKTTAVIKSPYQGRGLGLLSATALIFFTASLLLSFGLFFYRGYLDAQKKALAENLKKAEDTIKK